MSRKKKVLIFTYYWPPASSPGVWRFIKFAKFLPQFGWEPIIVTPKNGSYPKVDESLIQEVGDQIEVHKTKALEPFAIFNLLRGKKGNSIPEMMGGVQKNKSFFGRIAKFIRGNFFVPDPHVGWVPFAVKEGKRIINSEDIDAIITTSTPNSVHLIGRQLKREFPNLKWLIDFRDPWVSNYLNTEFLDRKRSVIKKDQKLEDESLGLADAVTGIGPGLLKEYEDRAAFIRPIYNGFDEEDFDLADSDLAETGSSEYFRLKWVGTLKPNMDIDALWNAVDELVKENEDFKRYFQLHFIGNIEPTIREKLSQMNFFKNHVIEHGYVSHSEALDHVRNTESLLFIVPRAGYSKNITSGKVFEYIGSQSEILALGPTDGDASEILNVAEVDPMIWYDDKTQIKKRLTEMLEGWLSRGKHAKKYDSNKAKVFTRKHLTGQLAEVLNKITQKQHDQY